MTRSTGDKADRPSSLPWQLLEALAGAPFPFGLVVAVPFVLIVAIVGLIRWAIRRNARAQH